MVKLIKKGIRKLSDRRGRLRIVFSHAKKYYSDAKRAISVISPEETGSVYQYLRDYAVQFSKQQVIASNRLSRAGLSVGFIYSALAFGSSFYFLSPDHRQNPADFFAIYPAIVAPLIYTVPLILIYFKRSYIYVIIGQILIAIAVSAIAAYISPHMFNVSASSLGQQTVFSIFLLSLTISSWLFTIIFIPGFLIASQLNTRRLLRLAPRYALINELVLIMVRLAEGDVKFSHPDTKKYVIAHLEQAAVYLSLGIPNSAALPSIASRTILQEKCSGAAGAIRALQVAVMLPDPKTYENLRATVARAIIAVAQDNLESLPRENVTTIERRGLSRIAPVFRTIIISAIPLAVLFVMRYASLSLSATFNNWAIAVGILWAVITLLSMLDPLYATRIKTMGDLISAIRGRDSTG